MLQNQVGRPTVFLSSFETEDGCGTTFARRELELLALNAPFHRFRQPGRERQEIAGCSADVKSRPFPECLNLVSECLQLRARCIHPGPWQQANGIGSPV